MSALWSEDNGYRLVSGVIVEVSGDQGTVKIPSFDDGLSKFGPCSLPAGASEGDACLVAFDENNQAWVISAGGGGSAIVEQVAGVSDDVADLEAALAALPKVKGGTSSATWTASTNSANVTIPHGLGVTPTSVAFATYTVGADFRLVSKDATNIVVQGFHTQGLTITGSVSFDWTVFKT